MTGEGRDGPGPRTPDVGGLMVDAMLGKLAVYLRMCGYDAAYVGDRDPDDEPALLERARAEGRVVLSRDRALVDRADEAVLVAEREVDAQLAELRAAGFELRLADPPTRCGRCNGALEPVPAGAARPDYAPEPDEVDCWRCLDCGQWFWKGSHWDRVRARVEAPR